MNRDKKIIVCSDASGASQAAAAGYLVMIVDVIDMSTTLESALDAGALAVLGCSPDFTRAPVVLNPEGIGREACRIAGENGAGIILICEPRVGSKEERLGRCQRLLHSLEKECGRVEAVLPNIGAEITKLADFQGRVVISVTDSGGVAFDAAFNITPHVMTGTVARTLKQKGVEPAQSAVRRALARLETEQQGVAVVAASRNSLEDVLAAQYIANLFLLENI